ncbi:MAG: hypothetical protein M5U26_03615 [Planctomycetota bacterium]|nr:hypothetical protein [Planctomycetota bacterium]
MRFLPPVHILGQPLQRLRRAGQRLHRRRLHLPEPAHEVRSPLGRRLHPLPHLHRRRRLRPRLYDDTTRMLKSYVTRAFPAYHLRNRFSNRVQSWLEDVPVTGDHYTAAHKVLAGLEVNLTTPGGEALDRARLLEELRELRIVNNGFYEAEFGNALREKGVSANPFDPDNRFIKAGERTRAALANLPGQVAAGGELKGLRGMDAQAVEGVDRVGHYLYKRTVEGLTPEAAAESVKKALFDYGDLSDFEKKYMGRAVFFYTWSRKAVPMMLEAALRRPGKVKVLTQLSGGATGGEGLPEHLPSWVREGLPMGLGKDAEGNPLLAYGLGTPLEGAADPFSGFAESPRRGLEKGLSQLNPLLAAPIELATDRNLFLGRDISESRKAPHWVERLPEEVQERMGVRTSTTKSGATRYEMDPYVLYAIENGPLGRLSNTIGKLADARKPVADRLLNVLTGAKVVSIDEEREAYYAQKDALRKLAKDLEAEGKVAEVKNIFRLTNEGKQDEEAKAVLAAMHGK